MITLIEDMILSGTSKMKIFREPTLPYKNTVEKGAAFTMRLLSFLYRIGMRSQTNISIPNVTYYAARQSYEKIKDLSEKMD